jgi:hypothetical protein
MNPIKITLAAVGSLLIAGCATDIASYRGSTPAFDLKQYFSGNLVASGVFIDYSGKVARRFTVDMTGTWQGDNGTLEEWFTYDNGEKQTRVWHLRKNADGHFEGRADDISGAAQGRAEGYALNWKYAMNLPYKDGTIAVKFDDWMYLVDEKRLINKAKVSKWGFQVGEVLLYMEKK